MRVVITGTNRGIGLALARQYLKRGDSVLATARHPESAPELAALQSRPEGLLHVAPLDVTDEAACQNLSRLLSGAAVDLLINNAGVGGGWGAGLESLDLAGAIAAFDTNALGALRVVRALRTSYRSNHSKIINM